VSIAPVGADRLVIGLSSVCALARAPHALHALARHMLWQVFRPAIAHAWQGG
jgi:hypothetical protein